MTRITIHASKQDISLPVTLTHIAAVLEHGRDSGLPAGEAVTLELAPNGDVIVTREDGQRFVYRIVSRRPVKPSDPAQLKLAI